MTRKEQIEALRLEIADNMIENSEGHFYCDECDWMIVMPGGRYGRCATSDGDVELVQHDVDCSFTTKRVALGLEVPLERRIETLRHEIEEEQDELSASLNSATRTQKGIEFSTRCLRELETELAEKGKVRK